MSKKTKLVWKRLFDPALLGGRAYKGVMLTYLLGIVYSLYTYGTDRNTSNVALTCYLVFCGEVFLYFWTLNVVSLLRFLGKGD